MNNFIKQFQMPYHIKRRVLDRFYTVLMYLFLTIVLFPILWMIYNSFKGNVEIVEGKLGFQRAPHNVIYTEQSGGKVWVCLSDGSVTIFDKVKNKILSRKRFNTFSTNFDADSAFIWLSSADKGLIRINKNNLRSKAFPVRWSDKNLDFNKISKTIVVSDPVHHKLWLTMGYQDFDKITEYNSQTMKIEFEYKLLDAFPYSYEKLSISSIYKAGDRLYAATNRGIVEIDFTKKSIVRIIENPDFAAADIRAMTYNEKTDTVFFSSISRVYKLNKKTGLFKILYTTIKGNSMEQISSLILAEDKLILGTGHGLIIINQQGKFIGEYMEPLFDDINKKGHLIQKGRYVNSEVLFGKYLGKGDFLLGTSSGRATIFNLPQKSVLSTVLIDKTGFINIHWRNYIDLFHNIDFALYLRNSFVVCGLTALFAMIVATLTAYALVRFDFPGKRFLSTAILSTQMIPAVMTLIPVYIMFIKFTEITGIPVKGTYWGMIFVYSAFFLPFSIWILRGFFASIPVVLEEAATIDGCTPLQIFYKIAVPLSIPGIVATGIFIFLVAWDELIFAWVLTNAQTMTIPVGIRLFVGNFQNRYDLLMAASTVATIPVMIMFILLQKQIVSGLTSGAVKD